MRLRILVVSAACQLVAFGMAQPAGADPIVVKFTAFPAAGDPVNTGPSTGSFTFDSSLIPPGGGQIQDSTFGLGLTDVNFRWSNTLWTRANADVGELQFSPSGTLLAWVLGNTNSIYGFHVSPASAVIDDIFVLASVCCGAGINYTNAGFEGLLDGRLLTNSVPSPVPEPSTVVLLATGAALLVRARRKDSLRDVGAKSDPAPRA